MGWGGERRGREGLGREGGWEGVEKGDWEGPVGRGKKWKRGRREREEERGGQEERSRK